MKINDILLENDRIEKKLEDLKRYLRENGYTKSVEEILRIGKYPTHMSSIDTDYAEVENKNNRKPKDTPEPVHDFLNKIIKDITGIGYRSSSLFTYVTYVEDFSKDSPMLYAAIPKPDAQACYIEGVNDFFSTYIDILNEVVYFIVGQVEEKYRKTYGESISSTETSIMFATTRRLIKKQFMIDEEITNGVLLRGLIPERRSGYEKFSENVTNLMNEKFVNYLRELFNKDFYSAIREKVENNIQYGNVLKMLANVGAHDATDIRDAEEFMINADHHILIRNMFILNVIENTNAPINNFKEFLEYLVE